MTLNRQRPDLPAWPAIIEVGGNEYLVEGKYVSYERYEAARWIVRLAAFAGFYLLAKEEFRMQPHWGNAVMILMGYTVGCAIISTIFPLPRWLCRSVFPKHSRVRFTRNAVVIDGHSFDLTKNVEVQFQASKPAILDRGLAREAPRQAEYLARFRRVEMVYGMRPFHIGTIEYEDRDRDFALALQWAYAESRLGPGKGANKPMAERPTREKRLPE